MLKKLFTTLFKRRQFVVFIWTLVAASCSNSLTQSSIINEVNPDTTYSISTMQLKNDKIPDSVFKMTNLRHLSINGMDCDHGHTNCWTLKEIPAAIKNLGELRTLHLTVNTIKTVPIELTALKNLQLFDLTDNAGFTNIENIAKIQSLEYLYLYGCGLTKLPGNIGNLKHLKELGLVGNHLDKVEQARIKKALPNCNIRF